MSLDSQVREFLPADPWSFQSQLEGPICAEANSSLPLKGDFERMARRRFQNPKPFREGAWWWIFVRRDVFSRGKITRR
jgi:hypothetical protein